MENTRVSARWAIGTATLGLLVLLGTVVAVRAFNDEPWSETFNVSETVNTTRLYQCQDLTFFYPNTWTVTDEPETEGRNLLVSASSPRRTVAYIYIDEDADRRIEVPDGVAPGDEAEFVSIYSSVLSGGPGRFPQWPSCSQALSSS
jgi:hypothetical protein